RSQHIVRPGLQRRQPLRLYPANVGMVCTTQHSLHHRLEPGGWRVGQDQKPLYRIHIQAMLSNNLTTSDRSKGGCSTKPCTQRKPRAWAYANCSGVSTPSATACISSASASPRIERTTSRLCLFSVRLWIKERSTLRTLNGN